MDTVTKKEYNIRDLGTKSVTLFPTRAQIVREIKDLQLAVRSLSLPGPSLANEVFPIPPCPSPKNPVADVLSQPSPARTKSPL